MAMGRAREKRNGGRLGRSAVKQFDSDEEVDIRMFQVVEAARRGAQSHTPTVMPQVLHEKTYGPLRQIDCS